MTPRDLWRRLYALILPARVERELDDELQFHLEMQTRKHVAAGLDTADARLRARADFGSTAGVADQCRDVRGITLLDTLWQDVRYAVRGFRLAPTFTLTVIVTIALGLGLNAAVFSVFNAYVLRPVAARDPSSLFTFTWTNRAGRGHIFTWPEFERFRRDQQVFSDVFASRKQLVTRIDGRPAFGELVTGDYFHVLGVEAARGRTLTAADAAAPGRESVVVLSARAWQRLFAGDPEIIGRTILLGGWRCEVVGVADERFSGLGDIPYDFWAPVTLDAKLEDGPDLFGPDHPARLELVGRLAPAMTERRARAALTLWAQQATADRRGDDQAIAALLVSRATSIPISPMVVVAFSPILVAFGLVMVIACANVANMMLARAMARQREIGIRLSLGAARARLVRQLLTESVLLSIPAALLGFGIADVTVDLGVRTLFATLPSEYAEYVRVMPLAPDLRVFWFMMAAAIASAILFGLAPALHATRTNVFQAARGDFMYDVRPARLRQALAVVHPLVRSVAATSMPLPLNDAPPTISITPAGISNEVRACYRFVSPEYFAILDVPVRQGRGFTPDGARSGAPVAIVSETAAQRLWPGQRVVGRSLRVSPDARLRPDARIRRYGVVQIIGIARDVAAGFEAQRSGLYLPIGTGDAGTALLVRVSGDAETARRSLDAALTAVDPGAVLEIHKMQEFVTGRAYPFRLAYWISATIGGIALLLTVTGLYGILSYLVAQRTKEIGIRMALGATVRGVTGLVLTQSLRLAMVGLPLGAALALGVSQVFASRLVMMNTFDLAAYAAGLLIVLIAVVGAAWLPALRAARIDPIATLRHD